MVSFNSMIIWKNFVDILEPKLLKLKNAENIDFILNEEIKDELLRQTINISSRKNKFKPENFMREKKL